MSSSVVLHPDQEGGIDKGEELSEDSMSKIGNLLEERADATMYGACRGTRMWQGGNSCLLLVHTRKLSGIILQLSKLACILCSCSPKEINKESLLGGTAAPSILFHADRAATCLCM